MMTKPALFAIALLAAAYGTDLDSANAEDGAADRNVRIMVEAARTLDLSYGPAYLLVKQETVPAPIGVIFGYVDNAAGCEELAKAISVHFQKTEYSAGTFKCAPIY